MNEMQVFEPKRFWEIETLENTIKHSYMGFFYILEYGEKVVKIGSTKKPYTRLKTLLRSAEIYGNVHIGRFAISAEHTNYRENEFMLHRFFKDSRRAGCELFDRSFSEILESLPNLCFKDEFEYLREKDKRVLCSLMELCIERNRINYKFPDPGYLADLITKTRREVLDGGGTPAEVWMRVRNIYQTWNIPVPVGLNPQLPGQINLFQVRALGE